MLRDESLAHVLADFPEDYILLNKDGSRWEGGAIVPLGDGGSSIVLRTRYRDSLSRAVKLMLPRDDNAQDGSGLDLFRQSFANEREALSDIRHEHIARLTDFNTIRTDSLGDVPFVAMELVEGDDLDKWARHDNVFGDHILTALDQLLDALAHLHSRAIMHCDVKEENFLVQLQPDSQPRIRSALVDLGVSHHISSDPVKGEWTYFFSTPAYVIPDLELVLGNKTHNRILKTRLHEFFPWQDLYSLGVVIGNLTTNEVVKQKLIRSVGFGGYQALATIGLGLKVRRSDRHQYSSVGDVQAALRRVSTSSLAPLGNSLLAHTGSKGIVIPGSSRRVVIPAYLDRVISHPLFQRLHNVPQLDLMQYVLPGATHTRFPHALRQMDLTRSAINQQLHQWEFRISATEDSLRGTIVSALLDSLGKYQFLHMFQDFLNFRGAVPEAGILGGDEVRDLLIAEQPNFLSELGMTRDHSGRSISDYLQIDWQANLEWQRDPGDRTQGFLSALLNSPIDTSKLAYLRADSAATGLPFGSGISADAIFEFLRVPTEADWLSRGQHGRVALGLSEDGISYAESAVLARHWNIQAGYWNRTNRALQAMVKYVIGELLSVKKLSFQDYLVENLHSTVGAAMAWLSGRFDQSVADGSLDKDSVNPLAELTQSHRIAYKRLLTISPDSRVSDRHADAKVYAKLSQRSPFLDRAVYEVVASVIDEFAPGLHVRAGEILLDVPRFDRDDSLGNVFVYSDPPDATSLGDLFEASPILGKLKLSRDYYVKRLRFYVHPRVHQGLRTHQQALHGALLARLRLDVSEGRL